MTKLEAILRETDQLSPIEVQQLVKLLLARIPENGNDHESEVGQRGLSAWTESTQTEDWSEFYPPDFTSGPKS